MHAVDHRLIMPPDACPLCQVPAYYALILRSLTVLEGLALTANPNYKVGAGQRARQLAGQQGWAGVCARQGSGGLLLPRSAPAGRRTPAPLRRLAPLCPST